LSGGFGRGEDLGALKRREGTVIGEDMLRRKEVRKGLTKDVHFIIKLAEEEIVMRGRRGGIRENDITDGKDFSTGLGPIRTRVGGVRATFGRDIDLGMNGELTETKEEKKGARGGEGFRIKFIKGIDRGALKSTIEAFFLIRGKGEREGVDDRGGRGTRDKRGKVREGAMKEKSGDDGFKTGFPTPERRVGDTDKGKETNNIF
jgi:hypothetical protein